MIHIQKFTFNPFQENTYLIYNNEKDCVVLDPGNSNPVEDQQLFDFIEEENLQPFLIFNTHAHLDHILGNQSVHDAYDIPVALHPKEKEIYKSSPQLAQMYGMPPFELPEPTVWVDVDAPLKIGEEKLQLLFTPGHSPGEVSLYHEDSKQLIAGDVLFRESIGRTDLPGGDHATLLESIRNKFWPLPEEVEVFCGHGPETTIGHEKENNPFLN
jgi:glyoxylase-like metal-dependent hydrolase (beta-lactamase superfamily II)